MKDDDDRRRQRRSPCRCCSRAGCTRGDKNDNEAAASSVSSSSSAAPARRPSNKPNPAASAATTRKRRGTTTTHKLTTRPRRQVEGDWGSSESSRTIASTTTTRTRTRKSRRRWRMVVAAAAVVPRLFLSSTALWSNAFSVHEYHQRWEKPCGKFPSDHKDATTVPFNAKETWGRSPRQIRGTMTTTTALAPGSMTTTSTTTMRLRPRLGTSQAGCDHTGDGKNDEEVEQRRFMQRRRVPEHVGFICDGNSRWARRRNLPALAGHAAGADRLVEVLRCLRRSYPDVRVCTFYAFSTENWGRPSREINDIFAVMEATIRQFGPVLLKEGVEFRALGDLSDERIPISVRALIQDLHVRTRRRALQVLEASRITNGNDSMEEGPEQSPQQPPILCVAINYGGRSDIVRAARELARQVASGEIVVSDITESALSSHLSTSDLPNPDLIIRTSGEARLSNFFLWDAAYTELCFCDELWPDFDAEALRRALRWYSTRHRRFGSRTDDDDDDGDRPLPLLSVGRVSRDAWKVGDRHNGTTTASVVSLIPADSSAWTT